MKQKLLYIFLTVVVLLNFVLMWLIFDQPHKRQVQPPQQFLIESLQFSERQAGAFENLDRAHRQRMRRLDSRLRMLKDSLFQQIKTPNFSPQSITEEIGKLSAEKEEEVFQFFSNVRKLCTSNQAIQFDAVIKEALRKGAPEGPPRPPKRGGRKERPRNF